MKAADIMTRDVATIGPEARVADAAAVMVERHISGLPVVNEARQIVGILTEGDLLHRVETETGEHLRSRFMQFFLGEGCKASDYVRSHTQKVSDLMTEIVISVAEDATLQDVVCAMEKHRVRRVPVVKEGVLVGVVSRHDLLRIVATSLRARQAGESDIEIEHRLRRELEGQTWAAAANVGIAVQNGVVRLEGTIFNEDVHRALVVAAENVAPGIVVDDRLVWCDPASGVLIPSG